VTDRLIEIANRELCRLNVFTLHQSAAVIAADAAAAAAADAVLRHSARCRRCQSHYWPQSIMIRQLVLAWSVDYIKKRDHPITPR